MLLLSQSHTYRSHFWQNTYQFLRILFAVLLNIKFSIGLLCICNVTWLHHCNTTLNIRYWILSNHYVHLIRRLKPPRCYRMTMDNAIPMVRCSRNPLLDANSSISEGLFAVYRSEQKIEVRHRSRHVGHQSNLAARSAIEAERQRLIAALRYFAAAFRSEFCYFLSLSLNNVAT